MATWCERAESAAIRSATASAWARSKAAAQKGPLGEFAGLGQPRPAAHEQRQELLHDVVGAVAADFHHVLAGVGARRPKQPNHYLINDAVLVADGAVVQRVARLVGQLVTVKHQISDANGLGPG